MKKIYIKKNYIIVNKSLDKIIYIKKKTHLIITGTEKKYQIEFLYKTICVTENIKTTLKKIFIQKKNYTIFYIKFNVIIEKNSSIKYITKIKTNKYAYINYNIKIHMYENTKSKNLLINYTKVTNIDVNINTIIKKSSNFKLYILNKLSTVNHNFIIDTTHENNTSSSLIKIQNVLKNLTNLDIVVKTNIKKIAKKSNANINCKTLLLNNTARCMITPQLNIYNNNIFCNHCVSIDNINKNIMQYILCRGYIYKDAKSLYIKSFLNETIKQFFKQQLNYVKKL